RSRSCTSTGPTCPRRCIKRRRSAKRPLTVGTPHTPREARPRRAMADATQGWLLEVRRGASGTDHLAFPRGQPVQPISLGLRGQWRIEADGVLDVHGYLYFDGQNLFVQSANVDSPLRVNGQAMGSQWAPVGAPCTIALGDARLVFHDAA